MLKESLTENFIFSACRYAYAWYQGIYSEFRMVVVLQPVQIMQTEIKLVKKHLSNSNESEISSGISTHKSGFQADTDKI